MQIKVFQEDELDTTARIAKNGKITMPLIKNAEIGGLTRQEAEQRLETQLKEYLTTGGDSSGWNTPSVELRCWDK